MTKALSITELAAIAAEQEDQTETQVTTFDNEPPPAGVTIGRFIEYIELGKQKQNDYLGKKKPDADSVRVTFELLHPKKNIHEYEVEGDTRIRADRVSMNITKKLSDKAKFKKLFNTLTYGRDIKHMAQMLGEAFIITVYHNVVEKDGKKNTYVNLDDDGVFGIKAPFIIDPLEETRKDVPVQEAISPLRLFLFNNPTKETWDSLFIDGTRERKLDGGAVEQVSKNWLQEKIIGASNYAGSALDQLLGGVADLPTEEEVEEAKAAAKKAAPKAAAKPADKPAAAKPAKPAVKAKAPADDALAALGLM